MTSPPTPTPIHNLPLKPNVKVIIPLPLPTTYGSSITKSIYSKLVHLTTPNPHPTRPLTSHLKFNSDTQCIIKKSLKDRIINPHQNAHSLNVTCRILPTLGPKSITHTYSLHQKHQCWHFDSTTPIIHSSQSHKLLPLGLKEFSSGLGVLLLDLLSKYYFNIDLKNTFLGNFSLSTSRTIFRYILEQYTYLPSPKCKKNTSSFTSYLKQKTLIDFLACSSLYLASQANFDKIFADGLRQSTRFLSAEILFNLGPSHTLYTAYLYPQFLSHLLSLTLLSFCRGFLKHLISKSTVEKIIQTTLYCPSNTIKTCINNNNSSTFFLAKLAVLFISAIFTMLWHFLIDCDY